MMENPARKNDGKPTRGGTAPGFVLREIDYRILQLIYEHRFLNTVLLWHLLKSSPEGQQPDFTIGKDGKRRPARYGFGMEALYKHLLRLTEAKYLSSQPMIDVPIGGSHGAARKAYSLGIRGAPIIAERTGAAIQNIRNIVDANRVKPLFIRHELEIARFRATLELACRDSEGKYSLIFWKQGSSLRDHVTGENESGGNERFPVNPDAFFGIHVEGKGNAAYILEMDRGTMQIISKTGRPDIRKKVLAYVYYRKSGKYRQRYYYSNMPNGKQSALHIIRPGDELAAQRNDLLQPIRAFSVLFVVPGILRGDKFTSGRIADILKLFPLFGKGIGGTSLFWFTTPGAYDIEKPESILGDIWITPNPDKGIQSLIG